MAAGRLMGALFKAVAPLPFDLMAGKEGNKEEVRPGPISPYSGRDCVKSLRSSYTGLYPQMRVPQKFSQKFSQPTKSRG